MQIIEKKIWPDFFELILSGKKKVELRLADFDINEGDELVLKEWDPTVEKYTGREMRTTVTYVMKTRNQTFWTQRQVDLHGFQIIQFEKH